MQGNPNNYFLGTTRQTNRPCECCNRSVKIDEDSPEVYGSGRFCSKICATYRTPEKYYAWKKDNPDEYEKWDEWKTKLEKKEVTVPGVEGISEIVFPAP